MRRLSFSLSALTHAGALGGSLLLAGCAGTRSDFPSLAPRAIERSGGAPAPTTPAAPAPVDPALAARLAAIEGDAESADARFRAALPPVQRLAAAAGPAGSEGWVQAQQSLSALGVIRAEGTTAFEELDERAHAIVASPSPSPGALDAISACEARLRALDAQHEQAMEAIGRQLAPGS